MFTCPKTRNGERPRCRDQAEQGRWCLAAQNTARANTLIPKGRCFSTWDPSRAWEGGRDPAAEGTRGDAGIVTWTPAPPTATATAWAGRPRDSSRCRARRTDCRCRLDFTSTLHHLLSPSRLLTACASLPAGPGNEAETWMPSQGLPILHLDPPISTEPGERPVLVPGADTSILLIHSCLNIEPCKRCHH